MSLAIRVLLVDDQATDRAAVRAALADDVTSFTLTEAGSRADFEARLAPGRFDLILSEFDPPGFEGLQVINAVRAVDPALPVVILTGAGSEAIAVQAMKRGAADYVIKEPSHLRRLPQTLRMVVEQAHQRAAVADANARYRELFRSVPVALFRFTLDGEVFFANPAFYQLVGLPEQAPPAHLKLRDLFEAEAELRDWLAQLDQAGLVRDYEAQLRHRDGRPVWVRGSARAVRDERFQVLYCEGSFEDVTARRQSEAALRESERRYRLLAEHMADVVWVLDTTTNRFRYVSPSVERLRGFSVDEVLAQTADQALTPDSWRDITARLPARLEAFRAGDPNAVQRMDQVEQTRRDGSTVWTEVSTTLLLNEDGTIDVIGVTRDISRRRAALEALEAREAQYRAIIDTALDGFCLLDGAGQLLDVNDAYGRMLGYSRVELLSKTLFDLKPAGAAATTAARLEQIRGEGSGRFVTHHRRRDGSLVEIEASVTYWPEQSGRFVCFLRDVTPLRSAEAALRESEARLAGLVDSVPDAILALDEAHRLVVFNPAAERLFGCSAADALGSLVDRFIPTAFRSAHTEILHRFGRNGAVQPDPGRRLHIQAQRADGSVFPAEATLSVAEAHGQRLFTVILRDLTQAQAAEERQRVQSAALAATASALVITDRDGRIEWVNPAYTRLTGYTVAEVLGQTPRVLKSGRHSPTFYTTMWATILSGTTWRGELVNRRKDNSLYQEEQTITPVLDEHGLVTHFIAVKQDITERKQRERELEAIVAVSGALRAAGTRAEMPPIILDQIAQLLDLSGAALALRDADGPVRLQQGEWVDFTGLRLPPDEALLAHVVATAQPYVSDDVRADERFYRGLTLPQPYAVVCVPLIIQQRALGALWAVRPAPFQALDVRRLTSIADIAASALHRAALHEQTAQRLRYAQVLHRLDRAVTASLDLRVTLNVLLEELTSHLAVHAADVLLLNPHLQTLEFAAGRGFLGRPFTGEILRLGQGYAGRAALEGQLLQAATPEVLAGEGRRAGQLAAEHFAAYAAVPLVAKGRVKGVLELFHRAPLQLDDEWRDFLETFAGQAAIAIENAELFNDLQQAHIRLRVAYDATVEGWSRALDLRDKETEGHTQRVTEVTLQLARRLGLDEAAQVQIRRGALLHDIGKMGVPDGILLKPGPLTEAEWAIMRQHPDNAYAMLAPIAFLRPALDIPYCHHEKWDGSGYPRGLKGDAIPLAARLFAVVDVWDALSSDRPYRPAWPAEHVREYIREGAGRHFDPHVVEAFLSWLDEAGQVPVTELYRRALN